MARIPARIPDPESLMHFVRADVDSTGRFDRCLWAMHRSGRIKRYSRAAATWMAIRDADGYAPTPSPRVRRTASDASAEAARQHRACFERGTHA